MGRGIRLQAGNPPAGMRGGSWTEHVHAADYLDLDEFDAVDPVCRAEFRASTHRAACTRAIENPAGAVTIIPLLSHPPRREESALPLLARAALG